MMFLKADRLVSCLKSGGDCLSLAVPMVLIIGVSVPVYLSAARLFRIKMLSYLTDNKKGLGRVDS